MENLFSCAMDIGEQMLISGAEVHRVEESISRICYALGAKRVDVFIITSSMVVTIKTADDKTYTQTRRVDSSNINFERVHLLNQLSREICEKSLTEQEIREKFKKAVNCKKYSFWLELASYAVIAAVFTLFFGGTVTESIVSLFIGAIVRVILFLCEKIISNKIFGKFLSTIIITFLAYLSVKVGFVSNVDKIIIGNIMTLIPGIGLTNALRDLFTGDSIAGLLRSIEAVLTALAIAAGYILVAFFGGFAI